MRPEIIARLKLDAIFEQINSIINSDVPFENAPPALRTMKDVLERMQERLINSVNLGKGNLIDSAIININLKILQFLPIIGFILRSTNTRNAFELFDPLQDLSQSFLTKDSRILLSSEWDYIPFVYPQTVKDLPTFTFIGLPASECSNLLIFPLTGHELAHSIWGSLGLENDFYADLLSRVKQHFDKNELKKIDPTYKDDIFASTAESEIIGEAFELAIAHCEEIFCDLFGLALFRESYIKAFYYVLSPGVGSKQEPHYPTNERRAEILAYQSEKRLNIRSKTHSGDRLTQNAPQWSKRTALAVQTAERALQGFDDRIWERVVEIVERSKIHRPSDEGAQAVLKNFRLNVPHKSPKCLGNITNACWLRFEETTGAGVSFEEARENLIRINEMGLKTVEVLEFHRRMKVDI